MVELFAKTERSKVVRPPDVPAPKYGHDEHVTLTRHPRAGYVFASALSWGCNGRYRGVRPGEIRHRLGPGVGPVSTAHDRRDSVVEAETSVGDGVSSSIPSFSYVACRYTWGVGTGRFKVDVIVHDASRKFPGMTPGRIEQQLLESVNPGTAETVIADTGDAAVFKSDSPYYATATAFLKGRLLEVHLDEAWSRGRGRIRSNFAAEVGRVAALAANDGKGRNYFDPLFSPDYFIHAANILLLVAYSVRDILWLRVFAVGASVISIPYFLLQPTTLRAPLVWTVVFALINLLQSWRLFLERRPVQLSPEEEEVRRLVFSDLPHRKVLQVLNIGSWTTAPTGERLIVRGTLPDAILLILRGTVKVARNGQVLGELHSGEFVGLGLILSGVTPDVDASDD